MYCYIDHWLLNQWCPFTENRFYSHSCCRGQQYNPWLLLQVRSRPGSCTDVSSFTPTKLSCVTRLHSVTQSILAIFFVYKYSAMMPSVLAWALVVSRGYNHKGIICKQNVAFFTFSLQSLLLSNQICTLCSRLTFKD